MSQIILSKAWNKVICFLLVFYSFIAHSQNIDLEGLKEVLKAKPVTMSGNVSANNIFNSINNDHTETFNHFFQGNLNINLFGKINLPFSFSFTNMGTTHTYPIPPNRLELHPTYKWIKAHMGQIALSFSPYTLNGHSFKGGGFDLNPNSPWKVSAMMGQLQKAVEYDHRNPKVLPSFERVGYGGKIIYEKLGYQIGLSILYAKDDPNSLTTSTRYSEITPQENLAICYTARLKPTKGFEVNIEYGNSALTLDNRNKERLPNNNYLKKLMGNPSNTTFYSAIKTELAYSFLKSTIGIGYERVDPDYQTLGAYYFNNDFKNLTIRITQAMFREKVSLTTHLGLQYDNLDNKKSRTTQRIVGNVYLNYIPTEKIQLSASYSNFQTYMNIKPPIHTLDHPLSFQNPDTLNFIQISQNAYLTATLMTQKSEIKNKQLNFNVSFQDASDTQGNIIKKGKGSQFYNLASNYTFNHLKKLFYLNVMYNISYNAIAHEGSFTHGPTISVNTQLLNKKMIPGISVSYNNRIKSGINQNSIFNLRLNVAYRIIQKHNLNLALINQYNSTLNKETKKILTGTLGYNYSF